MARGGYRPGAGRKPGSKDSKPRKGTKVQTEAAKIKQMLAYNIKAKAQFYREFLARVSKGDKLSIAEKKMMERLAVELSEGLNESEKAEAIAENLEPLAYMLKVMNNPKAENERRDRMAIAAAPFLHPRKGEGVGKKEEKADRAKAAGAGRFKASAPPQLKVVGKK